MTWNASGAALPEAFFFPQPLAGNSPRGALASSAAISAPVRSLGRGFCFYLSTRKST